MNVNKYLKDSVSGNFTSYDVSRAENTKDLLSRFLKKLCGHKENLLALRAQLFDANYILKRVWKANELKFYDSEISVYANMIKVVSEKHDKVEATAILLRRRFLLKDVDEAEERRSKKRKKENKKKAEKRLKTRSSEAIVKLVRLMVPERTANLSDEDLISPDLFNISTEELEKFDKTQLKPRFHLQGLKEMIEQEMFEDSSKASEIKDNLEKISSTTAENNKKKKERKNTEKCSRKNKTNDLVCCWCFTLLKKDLYKHCIAISIKN
jgi:hypothetical protein